MAEAIPVRFISSAQKTRELQGWKVQHTPHTCSLTAPPISATTPCAWKSMLLQRAKKNGKFSMRWQENIFLNSFLFSYESFSLRYRYTSNTIFSPGVLKIREMSVNWEEYSNHQETITNLEEWPVIKNIYVGPDSQVYRVWQIKHGRNMMTTVKCSAECQHEDGCNFYTMTQAKIAYPCEIRGEAITWLSVRMENHIKLCVHLPGNG